MRVIANFVSIIAKCRLEYLERICADSCADKNSIGELDLTMPNATDPRDSREHDSDQDVEAQGLLAEKSLAAALPTAAAEYSVQTRTKLIYLAAYFCLNLVLTIYNKAVLGGFAFPWLLTTLHTSFLSVGCYVLMRCGYFSLTKLDTRQNGILVAFSFLFTLNIAISNVSL